MIWEIDVVNFTAWRKTLITEEYYYDIKNLMKRYQFNMLNFVMLNAPSHLIVYSIYIDEELYKYGNTNF